MELKHYLITIGTSWKDIYAHAYLIHGEDKDKEVVPRAVEWALLALKENNVPIDLPLVLVTTLDEPKDVRRVFCQHDPEVAAMIEAAVDFHFSVILISKKEVNDVLLAIH